MPHHEGYRGVVGVVVRVARDSGAAAEAATLKAKVAQPGGVKLRSFAVLVPEPCTDDFDVVRFVFAPEVLGIHEGLLSINGRAVNQRFLLPVTTLPLPGEEPEWAAGMHELIDTLRRTEVTSLELLQGTKMDRIRDWSRDVSCDAPAGTMAMPVSASPQRLGPGVSRSDEERQARRRLRLAQQPPQQQQQSQQPQQQRLPLLDSHTALKKENSVGSSSGNRSDAGETACSSGVAYPAPSSSKPAMPRPHSADAYIPPGRRQSAGAFRNMSDRRAQAAPLAVGDICCMCYSELGAGNAYSLEKNTYCAQDFRALFFKSRKRQALVNKLMAEGRAGVVAKLPNVSLQGLKLRDVHLAQASFRRAPSHHESVALRKDCVALLQQLLPELLKSSDMPPLVHVMHIVNTALPERQIVVSEVEFLTVLAQLVGQNRSNFSSRVSTRLRSLRKGSKDNSDHMLGGRASRSSSSGDVAMPLSLEEPYTVGQHISHLPAANVSPAAAQWMMY